MHANIHALCVLYCGGINDSIGHSVMFTSFLRQDSTFFSLLCLQPGVSYYYVQDDILLVLTLQCTRQVFHSISCKRRFLFSMALACAESFVS